MTFKDIKVGYTTYHFHKTDEMKACTGRVISVSNPRFQNPTAVAQNPFATGTTTVQVVDVTIEENGAQKTYTIPENLELTYAGSDHVIATSKEKILAEVEAMKSRADEIVSSVDKNKKVSEQCQSILENWDPAIKEKRENEERLFSLENKILKMASLVENLVSKLS